MDNHNFNGYVVLKFAIDFLDRKPLGKSGELIPAVGIGTWAIRNEANAEKALVKAVELGLNLIDTAEMYGNGRAEELVGKVIRQVGRESVFIVTKMLPQHLVDKYEVIKAGRASLRRLGVREVDLFLIHWPNEFISIEKQVKNFEVLIDEGLTRYIGVSNFDVEALEEAVNATKKADIVADQVHYSVLHKEVEKRLLPKALELLITIQAYTPLERGAVLTHPKVVEVAKQVNKTPTQVALNYLISRPYVVAIVKSENEEHVKDIAGSLGWRLTKEQIEALEMV